MGKAKYDIAPERVEAFRQACAEGWTNVKLASAFGLPPKGHRVVPRLKRKYGIAPAKETASQARNRELDQRLIELWKDETLARVEIGKRLGLGESALFRRIKRLGLAPRAVDYVNSAGVVNMPWSKAEIAYLTHWVERGATAAAIHASWPAQGFPERSLDTLAHKLTEVRRAKNKKKGQKGVLPPPLLAHKFKDYLEKHGPTPLWRLADYAKIKDPELARRILLHLQRKGQVVRIGPKRKATWELAR